MTREMNLKDLIMIIIMENSHDCGEGIIVKFENLEKLYIELSDLISVEYRNKKINKILNDN